MCSLEDISCTKCRWVYLLWILLSFIGYSRCQISNDLDIDDIKKQIPGLEGFNSSQLPLEEVERLLKEKCEKNGGGEQAFNTLKNQTAEVQTCLEQYLNVTEIQGQVEKAKETGSMDEVFGQYCKKYPDIRGCLSTVIDNVKGCMDPQEQKTLNQSLKLVDELKEFICFKDGDRIAMFIAEGGVECLQSRKEHLEECANKTLGARIPTDMSVTSLPSFIFTERECSDFDKVRVCFNEELEKCKDSTPANIVDAFFKFLKKHLPCDHVAPAETKQEIPNSSIIFRVPLLFVVCAIAVSNII